MSGRPTARLWILCHPHNPTGRVFGRLELETIATVAAKHDLVVVSDEIHAELVHAGHRHIPFATLDADVAARTITVTSASKAFNLAGLRWAILHAGPSHFHDALAELPSTTSGAEPARRRGHRSGVDRGRRLARCGARCLDRNRHRLAELLARHLPGIVYRPPEATYLAWLDCRALQFGDDPASTFRQRGVELARGPRFGVAGAGHVRLNFATSPTVLEAIVRRMASSRRALLAGENR